MTEVEFVEYGPVLVRGEDEEFRVGYYDNDEWEDGVRLAVVYFCEPSFLVATNYHMVAEAELFPVDTESLFKRQASLAEQLYRARNSPQPRKRDGLDPYELVLEWSFVNALLAERMFEARTNEGRDGGRRVFISHSSVDKRIAVAISVDIANRGHVPWLDEWNILAGESIPLKISDGLEQSDFVLVLMGKAAVESGWVEAEWMTKYWEEVGSRQVRVIPVLLEECAIPTLLRMKKYADFRLDYSKGIDEVLRAIR